MIHTSPNGKETSKMIYKKSKRWKGVTTHWRENGQKSVIHIFTEGTLDKIVTWDEDGNKR